MGIDGLRVFLRRHRRIAIDTSIFIYQLEAHPRYDSLTGVIFSGLEASVHSAVTSTITMTELLVQPYARKDEALVERYYGLLATLPRLDWHSPDLNTADVAARLRADYRLRTPDALQAATALVSDATGFLTNDAIFKRVTGFETLVLDDLIRPS